MAIPTVIRHKTTATGFIVVVTVKRDARVQVYTSHPEGRTVLESEFVYGSEFAAIEKFDLFGEAL